MINYFIRQRSLNIEVNQIINNNTAIELNKNLRVKQKLTTYSSVKYFFLKGGRSENGKSENKISTFISRNENLRVKVTIAFENSSSSDATPDLGLQHPILINTLNFKY